MARPAEPEKPVSHEAVEPAGEKLHPQRLDPLRRGGAVGTVVERLEMSFEHAGQFMEKCP
jgi:hypothetical protein